MMNAREAADAGGKALDGPSHLSHSELVGGGEYRLAIAIFDFGGP